MPQAIRPAFINCARCGAEKKVGRSGPIPTYCSATCRNALSNERARDDGRYERRRDAARARAVARREAKARPCLYCGAPMTNPRRKQCGQDECKRAFHADRMRNWNRAYKEQMGEWPHRRYGEGQRAYERRRREEKGHWRTLYPARAAAYDARRRALVEQARTDETFTPSDVHERDDWTCKLCLLPIDPEIAWPDSMSPSVDHIVPLSRGGAHAMSNVQSAHLGCNSSKGDKDMVDAVAVLARLAGRG